MKINKQLSRRNFILSAGALALYGSHTPASANGCSSIEQLILAAEKAERNSTSWALTTATSAADELENRITKLETELRLMKSASDAAGTELVLSTINLVGSTLIFIAGVTAIVSAPVLFTTGVVFSGGMMIASVVVSPASPGAIELISEVEVQRLGGVLDTMGDSVYGVSGRAGTYSATAGTLVGSAALLWSTYKTIENGVDLSKTNNEIEILQDQLKDLRKASGQLKNPQVAMEIRSACSRALREDLQMIQPLCKDPTLP